MDNDYLQPFFEDDESDEDKDDENQNNDETPEKILRLESKDISKT